ncbi:PIN domain-containing protein [Streptomyces canus]|uniref:PIN domain-containing protein n=1 Tax=Streptomyces canus TaxID=58343 RepID=UPI002DDC12D3|nr:PIN domain-containing protein [Streptomyces canus]WSD92738.1 PIN domain-containing protein [Streptomyces canus]
MKPQPPAVLDSSALVAWVFREKGADVVDELLPDAATTAANLAEVTYVCLKRGYTRPPRELVQDLVALGLSVEPATADEGARAGHLVHESRRDKQQYGGRTLALGDALCIALAERLHRPLVTGDTLWKDMEDRFTVQVHLIR